MKRDVDINMGKSSSEKNHVRWCQLEYECARGDNYARHEEKNKFNASIVWQQFIILRYKNHTNHNRFDLRIRDSKLWNFFHLNKAAGKIKLWVYHSAVLQQYKWGFSYLPRHFRWGANFFIASSSNYCFYTIVQ